MYRIKKKNVTEAVVIMNDKNSDPGREPTRNLFCGSSRQVPNTVCDKQRGKEIKEVGEDSGRHSGFRHAITE